MDMRPKIRDEDDKMDFEVDEGQEEHPASATFIVVGFTKLLPRQQRKLSCLRLMSLAATPAHHTLNIRMTARITILEPVPIPAWFDSEVARLLAISSPPTSPLSPWSSSLPQIPFPLPPPIPSPSLPLSPPSPAAATSHSLPLLPPFILSPTRPDAPPPMPTSAPTLLPPLLLPFVSLREVLDPRKIRRDLERYVRYGITDSWDEIVETLQGAPVSTNTELGAHVREFESMVRRDTYEIYTSWDVIERLGTIEDASDPCSWRDLLETDRGRREEMRELRAADRTRQQQIIQTLTVMQTLQREMIPLQGLVTTLQGQVTALQGQVMALQGQVTALQGQQGPAGGPAQPELPEEAGSSS
ncbi:hypothetical protein Tco_1505702 [Tanacetum coccineum]